MTNVEWFSDIGIDDVPHVGGKNASLGEMYRELESKGVRVPNGFATTAGAFREFLAFNELDPQSAGAKTFVALEDWLNDGVALTIPVAGECLLGWYGRNAPALGDWRIGGHVVAPEQVDLPTLCIVPDGDRIVPPEAAVALAKRLPDCHTLRPKAGHIGMIVSARARARVWQPLVDWIGSLPAD